MNELQEKNNLEEILNKQEIELKLKCLIGKIVILTDQLIEITGTLKFNKDKKLFFIKENIGNMKMISEFTYKEVLRFSKNIMDFPKITLKHS